MARITGVLQHRKHLERMRGNVIAPAITQAMYVGAQNEIQIPAQLSISQGAVSGKSHEPSEPGSPPNNDTGVLAGGIETEVKGVLRVEVTSNAPYSAALEFGSERKAGKAARSFAGNTSAYGPSKQKQGPVLVQYGDSSVPERPFMRPAVTTGRPKVLRRVADAVRREVRRGG